VTESTILVMPTASTSRTISNPAIGDVVTFLETAEESGGARTYVEIELAPHGGNAPHRHLSYAEHFECLEGTLNVKVGRSVLRLAPGETATAPQGSVHHFANPTDEPCRFRVELTPGHAGFENSLRIAYGLAEDGLVKPGGMPRSLTHIALLAEMGDMGAAGTLRVLTPFVGLLARRGRRRGIERDLIERYVS
jgi:quercetin dioxygenase-like cupin family protein